MRRSEFQIIEDLFRPLTRNDPAALGLKDDAALLPMVEGEELAITSDTLIAGVHFLDHDTPDLIARKALRVNLSDLAAMGAKPVGFLMAAAFPQDISENWLERFALGLRQDIDTYAVPLLGGDTVGTPGPLTLTVTAFGTVRKGQALRRNTATKGQGIYVSGTIGDGAIGLQIAREEITVTSKEIKGFLRGRYRLPKPQLALGQGLAGMPWMGACMDISDGLIQDLGHICAASRVAATIELERVPVSEGAQSVINAHPVMKDLIIRGGDDYELLFTADCEAEPKLLNLEKQLGIKISRIGTVCESSVNYKSLITIVDKHGQELDIQQAGYNHFAASSKGGLAR